MHLARDHDRLNIGSLTIDPKDPAVIYCGTGEANLSVDSYTEVGIYRTGNGGETWKLLASSDETGVPTRIGVIAIDPFDSKHLRIGGVGANESSTRPKDFGRNVCFTRRGRDGWGAPNLHFEEQLLVSRDCFSSDETARNFCHVHRAGSKKRYLAFR